MGGAKGAEGAVTIWSNERLIDGRIGESSSVGALSSKRGNIPFRRSLPYIKYFEVAANPSSIPWPWGARNSPMLDRGARFRWWTFSPLDLLLWTTPEIRCYWCYPDRRGVSERRWVSGRR